MVSLAQNLRETNGRLCSWLDSMATKQGQPALATPEHIAALLSELLRAGAGLRAEPLTPRGDDPELDRELAAYRRHVERLRELLPSIHTQLLAERARLEAQRARVRSAAEWARASRQTL
jgi:uncharacterized protein (DUF849 family)